MPATIRRRTFLESGLAAAAAAALGPFGARAARAAVEATLKSVPLTERVTLVTGAGGNVVVLRTDDGLVLVDSGAPERADALRAHLDAEFGGAPVRIVFNTHWHPQHTGGNDWLGAAGARIVAHSNTRLWMGTEYYVDWEKKNYTPRAAVALPIETFRSSDPQPLALVHGGQRIEYGHLPEAHTDGDIYVHLVDENVVVAGDVLAAGAWPVLDYATGGWIGGMQESMRILLGIADAETQLVPGEGAPLRLPALEAQREMLDTMHERIRVRIIAAKSIDEIVADNVAEGYEALGDTRRFVTNVYQGLWWTGRLRGAY
jgi:glyoxylase-like metal-dependent hydrolase (beta-lactamase superfamily II)